MDLERVDCDVDDEPNGNLDMEYMDCSEDSYWDFSNSIASMKIGFFDLMVLLVMWLMILVCSVKSYGKIPGYVFLFLNLVLVIRRPVNGLLVLILMFFSPAQVLLIPRGFVASSAIAGLGYIMHGMYLKSTDFFLNKMFLATSAFVALCCAVFFIMPGKDVAKEFVVEYIEGLIFVFMIFALINSKEDLGVSLKWLAMVAGLVFIVNLIHYNLSPNTFLFRSIEQLHGLGSTVGRSTVTVSGWDASRFLWPGVEPNYFASQLLLPLSVAVAFFTVTKNAFNKFFWLVVSLLIGLAILGTFSRGGAISTMFFMFLYLIKRKGKAIIPAITMIVIAFAFFAFVPAIRERIMSIPHNIATSGGTGRIERFRETAVYWFSSPIWGHGLGSVVRNLTGVTHNAFLQVLAELGIIGEILYLTIIYLAYKSLKKVKLLYDNQLHPDVILANLLIMGLLSTCLSISGITPQDPKFLWLLCALSVMFYRVLQRQVKEQQFGLEEG